MGRSRRDLSDLGASLVEYSLALVLVALVTAVVVGSLGTATSEAFGEVAGSFSTDSTTSSPLEDVSFDAFDELLERIAGIGSLGNSLAGKAEDAERQFLTGDIDGAIDKLASVINDVDIQQGKQLSYDDAASVRNAARRLVDAIGAG